MQIEIARNNLVELGVDPDRVCDVIKGLEDKIKSETDKLNACVKDIQDNIKAMEKELNQ